MPTSKKGADNARAMDPASTSGARAKARTPTNVDPSAEARSTLKSPPAASPGGGQAKSSTAAASKPPVVHKVVLAQGTVVPAGARVVLVGGAPPVVVKGIIVDPKDVLPGVMEAAAAARASREALKLAMGRAQEAAAAARAADSATVGASQSASDKAGRDSASRASSPRQTNGDGGSGDKGDALVDLGSPDTTATQRGVGSSTVSSVTSIGGGAGSGHSSTGSSVIGEDGTESSGTAHASGAVEARVTRSGLRRTAGTAAPPAGGSAGGSSSSRSGAAAGVEETSQAGSSAKGEGGGGGGGDTHAAREGGVGAESRNPVMSARAAAVAAVVREAGELYKAVVTRMDVTGTRRLCEPLLYPADRRRYIDPPTDPSLPTCLEDIRRKLPDYRSRGEVWRDFKGLIASRRRGQAGDTQFYRDLVQLDRVLSQKRKQLGLDADADMEAATPVASKDDSDDEAVAFGRAMRDHKYFERREREDNRELVDERARLKVNRGPRMRSDAERQVAAEARAFEFNRTLFVRGPLPMADYMRLAHSEDPHAIADGLPAGTTAHAPFAYDAVAASDRRRRRRSRSRDATDAGSPETGAATPGSVSALAAAAASATLAAEGEVPPVRGPGQIVVTFTMGGKRLKQGLADMPSEYLGPDEHLKYCRLCKSDQLLDPDAGENEHFPSLAQRRRPLNNEKQASAPGSGRSDRRTRATAAAEARGASSSRGFRSAPQGSPMPRSSPTASVSSVITDVHTPKVRVVDYSALLWRGPDDHGNGGAASSGLKASDLDVRASPSSARRSPSAARSPSPNSRGKRSRRSETPTGTSGNELSIRIPRRTSSSASVADASDSDEEVRAVAAAEAQSVLHGDASDAVAVAMAGGFACPSVPAPPSRSDLPRGLAPLPDGLDDGYNKEVTKAWRRRYREGLITEGGAPVAFVAGSSTPVPVPQQAPIACDRRKKLDIRSRLSIDRGESAGSATPATPLHNLLARMSGTKVYCAATNDKWDRTTGILTADGRIACDCGCGKHLTPSAFASHAGNGAHRPMLQVRTTEDEVPLGDAVDAIREALGADLHAAAATASGSSRKRARSKSGGSICLSELSSTISKGSGPKKRGRASRAESEGSDRGSTRSTTGPGRGRASSGGTKPGTQISFRDSLGALRVVDPERPHFRGVHCVRRSTGLRYRAQIERKGMRMSLGTHDDPIDAARAYDDAAVELFNKNAVLNLPRAGFMRQTLGQRLGFVYGAPTDPPLREGSVGGRRDEVDDGGNVPALRQRMNRLAGRLASPRRSRDRAHSTASSAGGQSTGKKSKAGAAATAARDTGAAVSTSQSPRPSPRGARPIAGTKRQAGTAKKGSVKKARGVSSTASVTSTTSDGSGRSRRLSAADAGDMALHGDGRSRGGSADRQANGQPRARRASKRKADMTSDDERDDVGPTIATGQAGWLGEPLCAGSRVDVLGTDQAWWAAEVTHVIDADSGRVRIHFCGWSKGYDEAILLSSGRIVPSGTHVQPVPKDAVGANGEGRKRRGVPSDQVLRGRMRGGAADEADAATAGTAATAEASQESRETRLPPRRAMPTMRRRLGSVDSAAGLFADEEGVDVSSFLQHPSASGAGPDGDVVHSSLPPDGSPLAAALAQGNHEDVFGIGSDSIHSSFFGMAADSADSMGLAGEFEADLSHDQAATSGRSAQCSKCGTGGDLVRCNAPSGCTRSFHIACAPSVLSGVSNGQWRCEEHSIENPSLDPMSADGYFDDMTLMAGMDAPMGP